MDNIDIQPDVLNDMIRQQQKLEHNSKLSKVSLQNLEYTLSESLGAVQKAQGKRKDPVQRLCDSARIKKQTLAAAIIFELDGDISCIELARRLHIHPATLRKPSWRKIRDLIVAKY